MHGINKEWKLSSLHFLLKKALNCMPIMFKTSSFVSLAHKDPPEFILSMPINLSMAKNNADF